MRAVLDRLPDGTSLLDGFTRQRLGLLLDLARRYDVAGGSLEDFLRLATAHARRAAASTANVQILTIHRSKGLGFDVVFLPVLDTTRMDASPRAEILSMRNENLETEWLLHRPSAALCECDSRLLEAHQQQVADAAYDELCVWYVGLTRAKHALHVFTVQPAKSGGASPVAFIHAASGGGTSDGLLWERGDADWFRQK